MHWLHHCHCAAGFATCTKRVGFLFGRGHYFFTLQMFVRLQQKRKKRKRTLEFVVSLFIHREYPPPTTTYQLNASFKRFNPLTVLFPPLLVVHQCFDVFQPFHISGGKINNRQTTNHATKTMATTAARRSKKVRIQSPTVT